MRRIYAMLIFRKKKIRSRVFEINKRRFRIFDGLEKEDEKKRFEIFVTIAF